MKIELDKWLADGMIEAGGTDAILSDTDIGSMLDDAITGEDTPYDYTEGGNLYD